tara:strand:+ start:216 stop:1553 length:1338 start_codon:yes stop_codon:yes gene_type:complete
MASNLFTSLFNALSDPKSYYALQKEMNLKAVAETFFNSLAGKTTFDAVILPEDVGSIKTFDGTKAVRVRPIGIYDMIIPEPCVFKNPATIKRILALHPIAYPDSDVARSGGGIQTPERLPFSLRVVECFYRTGPQENGKLRGLTYRTKTTNSGGRGINLSCLESEMKAMGEAANAFANGGYAPNVPTGENFPDGEPVLTKFGGKHIIEKMEKKLKVSTSVVSGVGSAIAATQAIQEIQFWDKKNERDAGTKGSLDKTNPAYKRIQLYNYYGIQSRKRERGQPYRKTEEYWPSYATDEKVAGTGILGSAAGGKGDSVTGIMHWSATSVSWAMRGTGFPAREGHSGYSGNIVSKKADSWEAHSLIKGKIIPKLGDVVVKTAGHGKEDTEYTASHGDIIVRIDKDFAYTAGGNIDPRGVFKETRKMKLAADGTILSPQPYLIILKKMK